MPFFTNNTARIYYEDTGQGEPVIAVHGLLCNTTYWKHIAPALRRRCRLIAMDMRGHGRTLGQGKPYGFTWQDIAADIDALADHLELERFHLLAHSTGGFVCVRYAMHADSRLASLMLTNTSSATSVIPGDEQTVRNYHSKLARRYEELDWPALIYGAREQYNPLLRGVVESGRADELLAETLALVEGGDRMLIARFIRSFYTDPDPRVEGLRSIGCPVLIVYGRKDDLFVQSSKLMASEIPGARLIEYEDAGHMTALECPERLQADILDFLARHPLQIFAG